MRLLPGWEVAMDYGHERKEGAKCRALTQWLSQEAFPRGCDDHAQIVF